MQPVDDPLLGTEVGRYRIERLLGAGGMGSVYLGVQPAIGSRVAIKVLSDQCARDPGLLERFFSEARAVNLIRHEHIVSVIDLAQLPDGRPYIVMEFVDGLTFASYVRGGTASIGGVIAVMMEVLGALAAAHAIGIVHRDLKPDNIIITAAGHAKVLDFGIAKLAPGLQGALSPRTQTGMLLGTPAYMAPEQISGGQVDARTDLYAAGVVLFEAMTGRVPFAGDTLYDLMRAHLEQAPPSPCALRPELPIGIEQVILQALAKRPDDRFSSAAAMVNALEQASASLSSEQWRRLAASGTGAVMTRPSPMLPPMPGALPPPSPSPSLANATTIAQPQPQPWPTGAGTAPSRERLVLSAIGIGSVAIIAIVALVTLTRSSGRSSPPTANPSGPTTPELGSGGVVLPGSGATLAQGSPPVVIPPRSDAPPDAPIAPTSIERPPDYDPKHFDPLAYLAKAQAVARELIPDARLTELEFHQNVFADGHVDLTLPADFESDYDFRSPSRSVRPTGVPANSPIDIACRVNVTVTAKGIEARIVTSETCTDALHDPPHCTFAQIWAKARSEGVRADNVVATVGYLHDGTWFFDLDDDVKSYDDKCP